MPSSRVGRLRWLASSIACVSVALAPMAMAGLPAKRPASPAGFAVVPDPNDQAIEFEPNGPASLPVTPPSRAGVPVAASPAPLPPVLARRSVPDATMTIVASQAPPPSVLVTFPNHRLIARSKADAVTSLLRGQGLRVEEREADRPGSARARILFAFEEDRAEAATVNRALRAAYGLDSPMTLSPAPDPATPPGAIEIALPG